MKLDTILKDSHSWIGASIEKNDVILGTLGRVSRSLRGHSFPGWSTDEDRRGLMDYLRPHVQSLFGYKTAFHAEMSSLDWQQRRLLLERKLISPCMAARQDGCEIFIPRKQDSVVMTNEEEHLVIHNFATGFKLAETHAKLLKSVEKLETQLNFAKDEKRGYLTSLPFECGDAIQLYVLLHLPATTCTNVIPQLHAALDKLELGMQPFYADEHEDTGNMFILHCHPTSYNNTKKAISKLEKIALTIVDHELNLRKHLLETREIEMRDLIGRALGILLYSSKLSFKELADSLSLIRLGLSLGVLHSEHEDMNRDEIIDTLIDLYISLAPAHLRRLASLDVEGSADEVQHLRSQLVQSTLNQLSIKFTT